MSHTPGLPSLCATCTEAAYGYEPDMGDDEFTFESGTCSNVHVHAFEGIVFTLAI